MNQEMEFFQACPGVSTTACCLKEYEGMSCIHIFLLGKAFQTRYQTALDCSAHHRQLLASQSQWNRSPCSHPKSQLYLMMHADVWQRMLEAALHLVLYT